MSGAPQKYTKAYTTNSNYRVCCQVKKLYISEQLKCNSMEESNNLLKVLLRNTDSDTEAKGTKTKATTTQQSTQMPWSVNVISNLESGINSGHLMALIANYSGLESLERGGKAKEEKAFNPRDPDSYQIFKLRKVKSALKKNGKSLKALRLKSGLISQKAQLE